MGAAAFARDLCGVLPREWVERMHYGKKRGTHIVYDDSENAETTTLPVHIFHPVMWVELRTPVPVRGVLCAAPPGYGSSLAVFHPVSKACRLILNPRLLVPREEDCNAAKAKCLEFMCTDEHHSLYDPPLHDKRADADSLRMIDQSMLHTFQAWALYASTLDVVDWSSFVVTAECIQRAIAHTFLQECVYLFETADHLGMIRAHACQIA